MATDFTSILNSTDMNVVYQQIASYFGISMGTLLIILAVISIWSLVWKGLALWKSARKGSWIWFIVILVFNTIGILEILYIYVFSELGKKQNKSPIKGSAPEKKKKI